MNNMKKFAVRLITAGTLMFLAGIFDVFHLSSRREDYFIYFGIPLAFLGIGMMIFCIQQETRKPDRPGYIVSS
jgi:uncharacterized membrane protein